jgi:xanthine/uracil permease
MERDNPLDGVSDEQLIALFKLVDAPAPSADFARRTMRAVMRAPLPAGRKALRDPLMAMFGWAAVIVAVALSAGMIAASSPIVTSSFSRLITHGVGTGMWLLQFAETVMRVLDVLTTTGVAVSRAAVTAEGTTGLVLTAVVGALSLSALHRLLISEREDSQWQELS